VYRARRGQPRVSRRYRHCFQRRTHNDPRPTQGSVWFAAILQQNNTTHDNTGAPERERERERLRSKQTDRQTDRQAPTSVKTEAYEAPKAARYSEVWHGVSRARPVTQRRREVAQGHVLLVHQRTRDLLVIAGFLVKNNHCHRELWSRHRVNWVTTQCHSSTVQLVF